MHAVHPFAVCSAPQAASQQPASQPVASSPAKQPADQPVNHQTCSQVTFQVPPGTLQPMTKQQNIAVCTTFGRTLPTSNIHGLDVAHESVRYSNSTTTNVLPVGERRQEIPHSETVRAGGTQSFARRWDTNSQAYSEWEGSV